MIQHYTLTLPTTDHLYHVLQSPCSIYMYRFVYLVSCKGRIICSSPAQKLQSKSSSTIQKALCPSRYSGLRI